MSLNVLIRSYANYNAWANHVLADFLRKKPREALSQYVVSSFPGIIPTLSHIVDAQEFWMSVVSGENLEVDHKNDGRDHGTTADDVLNSFVSSSDKLKRFLDNLSDEGLHTKVFAAEIGHEVPIYDLVQHCLNHSTYHRGQLTTIFRQIGFDDIPTTDYDHYLKVRFEKM